MIRRVFMLTVLGLMFLYTLWNFYVRVIRFDPLSGVTAAKAKGNESAETLFASPQKGWKADIHEKNIFSPSRTYLEPKPVLPAVVTAPVEPPRRPELALRGIVLDNFGEHVAYIEIDKARPVPVRKGDKADTIEVVDISDRQVVVKWNEEKINLSLDKIKMITNPRLGR